jgi:hypothetical protein
MAHPHARIASSFALLALVSGCPDSHGVVDAPLPFGDACGCSVDAPAPDAPALLDAGTASCAPQDAHAEICPGIVCDGYDNYAWDGERCVFIPCGTCRGADCAGLPTDRAECQRAHASCDAALCTATGGDWQFWAEECGHYECGFPVPADCRVGMPVCDCGYTRSFEPGVGCVTASCPDVDPQPPEIVCGSTGGTWTEGICCPTTCGVFCDADCLSPACVCGPFQVFDSIRGCIDATECFERSAGETCTNAATRCEGTLICCQTCTGVGCEPDSSCRAPVCDMNPDIDECGNNRLAP